jgi:hypothetical protein
MFTQVAQKTNSIAFLPEDIRMKLQAEEKARLELKSKAGLKSVSKVNTSIYIYSSISPLIFEIIFLQVLARTKRVNSKANDGNSQDNSLQDDIVISRDGDDGEDVSNGHISSDSVVVSISVLTSLLFFISFFLKKNNHTIVLKEIKSEIPAQLDNFATQVDDE